LKKYLTRFQKNISFDWYGSGEFESWSLASSNNSSSHFMVNEDTTDFSIIYKNPTIQEFKYINVIFQAFKSSLNTTLIKKNIDEDEEYNLDYKNWILVPSQLEEGSHMLIEEIIDVDLSDDPNNMKIIQLGKSLSEKERDIFMSILK